MSTSHAVSEYFDSKGMTVREFDIVLEPVLYMVVYNASVQGKEVTVLKLQEFTKITDQTGPGGGLQFSGDVIILVSQWE